jgi:hypothetical protein
LFPIFEGRGVFAATDYLRVSRDGHWLEFLGKKVMLVGDSVTQGWQELGTNFNQREYVDALTSRGINLLMLWSFIGSNSFLGVVDQKSDPRIGYYASKIWPWVKYGGKFDLSQFNDSYFDRLSSLIQYAYSKNILVLITVHDGWTKTRFSGHPFNLVNGGPLMSNSQYVELYDYNKEMPHTFDLSWNRKQKHQYFLERFCEKLIQATEDLPNVMYEIFNEGEWYNQQDLRRFQVHFLNFFKARTNRLLLINADYVAGLDFRIEAKANVISNHKISNLKIWNANTSAKAAFDHYSTQFRDTPPKPFLFSETPTYRGNPSDQIPLMRLMWGTLLGGAGFVVQNDASFGFDPNVAIKKDTTMLDLEGHAARFFNTSGIALDGMSPGGGLSSTGVVLARPGSEYVVYSQDGSSFTLDLSGSSGSFIGRFYNPHTGRFQSSFTVNGGVIRTIQKPDREDWVLHLKKTEGGQ